MERVANVSFPIQMEKETQSKAEVHQVNATGIEPTDDGLEVIHPSDHGESERQGEDHHELNTSSVQVLLLDDPLEVPNHPDDLTSRDGNSNDKHQVDEENLLSITDDAEMEVDPALDQLPESGAISQDRVHECGTPNADCSMGVDERGADSARDPVEGQMPWNEPYLCQRYRNETESFEGKDDGKDHSGSSDPSKETGFEIADNAVDDAFAQIYDEEAKENETEDWTMFQKEKLVEEKLDGGGRSSQSTEEIGTDEDQKDFSDEPLSYYGGDQKDGDEGNPFSGNDHDLQLSNEMDNNNQIGSYLKEEQGSDEVGHYDRAATKIQAGYRGFRERQLLKNRKNEINTNNLLQLQHHAAAKIQAGFRGHRERQKLKRIKKTKDHHQQDDDLYDADVDSNKDMDSFSQEPDERRQNLAATKIQANYRGFRVRKQIKCHVQDDDEKRTEKDDDDDGVGSPMIINKSSNEYDPSDEERKHAAATKIQASYRGFRTRSILKHKDKHQQRNKERENLAATKIQATFRGYRDRQRLKNGISHRHHHQQVGSSTGTASLEKQNAAATKIQATYRGFRCRKNKKSKPIGSQHHRSSTEDSADLLNAAAVKIQAGFRGYRVRKAVKQQISGNRHVKKPPGWLSKHRGLPQSRRGSLPEDKRISLLRDDFRRRGSDSTLLKDNKLMNDSP